MLGLCCCMGSSLGVASRATHRCGARTSHCRGFSCCGAQALGPAGFSSCGSRALEHRLSSRCGARKLSCFSACGIFLDQGSNLCLLHRQGDSATLSHQGSPLWLLLSLVSHHQACCLPLLTETPSISLGFLTPLPNTSSFPINFLQRWCVCACVSSPKNTRIPQYYIPDASSACLMPFSIYFTNFHGFSHHPFIPSTKISLVPITNQAQFK